ncbi:MAG: hypothetical protein L6R42_003477 [Xanthoria sp. 1 TBL-2021]|nr:MAG: hypothetical protein L6R42_003477 [Xanthoria sp. 1 TBL-2021]
MNSRVSHVRPVVRYITKDNKMDNSELCKFDACRFAMGLTRKEPSELDISPDQIYGGRCIKDPTIGLAGILATQLQQKMNHCLRSLPRGSKPGPRQTVEPMNSATLQKIDFTIDVNGNIIIHGYRGVRGTNVFGKELLGIVE